eukprot:2399597-Amphidinium_carterae.1
MSSAFSSSFAHTAVDRLDSMETFRMYQSRFASEAKVLSSSSSSDANLLTGVHPDFVALPPGRSP